MILLDAGRISFSSFHSRCMPLSAALLRKLVCPKCKGELEYRQESSVLVCSACRLQFAVKDDIPVMLLSEATALSGH